MYVYNSAELIFIGVLTSLITVLLSSLVGLLSCLLIYNLLINCCNRVDAKLRKSRNIAV